MNVVEQTNSIASKNSGILLTLLLFLQVILVPVLGWGLTKIDAMQQTTTETQKGQAVFSDRQLRQGRDIADIKSVLKGVESKEAAKAAHKEIWKTDQDQYRRIKSLDQQQRKLENRVQRLEIMQDGGQGG